MALKAFSKTVTSAGTAEALKAAATPASSFVIRAMENNSGAVYVGDSAVAAGNSGKLERRAALTFGGDQSVGEIDLNAIYVDAGTSSDGVDVWYLDGSPT